MTTESSWWVYLLCCADGSFYTGITTDTDRRLHEHNHETRGARYTRSRRPVRLVYRERVADRAEAARREYAIRRLSRASKQVLVQSMSMP